ncbi:MAG: hypothetical protein A2879_01550 [Omnitrophica WOR_2 bacterium RIFCSPHIGHO2_01_FULL_49_10]|nr:MAG: hypothetical protein A2879_01550 [Omnitrophica WOR_2 bacterium RIFCSPHIGHO2_01_FULL_49_10]
MRSCNKILIVSVALFVSLGLSSLAEANLLINPGFETGTFSGWTPSYFGSESILDTNPHMGQYHGRIYQYGWISQRVDDVTPNVSYKLSSWVYMPQDGGYAAISITFYNATGSTSRRYERGWERYPGNQQYDMLESDWLIAPDFTAYAKVECSVNTAPNYIDFDDVSLTAIPEPSSLALLLTGVTGLFGLSFKKRK